MIYYFKKEECNSLDRASYKRIIITTIIIFLIGWLGNFIIEDYGPSFLLISINRVSVLTTEIWQVQALLTTIVIAINALSLGFLNKKVYGYNVLDYLFTRKKLVVFYLQTDLIIIMFWLILINYFFVVYDVLFGSLFLLFITVILITLILSETMKLLTQFKKIENEIRDYVKKLFEEENKDDLRLEIINNIKEHNELANRNNEVDTVEKNVDLALELSLFSFNQEKEQQSEILNSVQELLIHILNLFMQRKNLSDAINLGYKLIKFTRNNKLETKIEKEFFSFYFEQIGNIKYFTKEMRSSIYRILSVIHESIIRLQEDENKDELQYEIFTLGNIVATTYSIMNKNDNLSKADKHKFFIVLRDFVRFNHPKGKKYYYLMFLLRRIIHEKDIDSFEYFKNYIHFGNKEEEKVRLTLNIYLYYLAYQESQVINSDYRVFYKYRKVFNMGFYLNGPINSVWELIYYEELNEWEVFPEGFVFKEITMERVIIDYLILLELKTNQELMHFVEDNDIERFIMALSDKKRLKAIVKQVNDNFEITKRSMELIEDKLDYLLEYFKHRYLRREINKLRSIDMNQINNQIENKIIENNILDKIKSESFIQYFNLNDRLETMEYRESIYCQSYFFFENKIENYFFDLVKEVLIKIINQMILESLQKNVLSINRNLKNKLQLLESKLNSQHTTVMRSLNMDYLKYFEEQEYYDKYIDRESSFNIIETRSNNQFWFNFTAEKIDVNLKSISIEVKKLDKSQIEEKLEDIKVENTEYEVNLFNDLKARLNKEEAEEYVKSQWVRINFSIELGVRDKNSMKGLLVLFTN